MLPEAVKTLFIKQLAQATCMPLTGHEPVADLVDPTKCTLIKLLPCKDNSDVLGRTSRAIKAR